MLKQIMLSELPDILRLLAALSFVIALMGGLAFILKKLGLGGATPVPTNKKRLKLIESLSLDPRRRLVIIQRDDKQHLVLMGINGETVVETDIKPADDQTPS